MAPARLRSSKSCADPFAAPLSAAAARRNVGGKFFSSSPCVGSARAVDHHEVVGPGIHSIYGIGSVRIAWTRRCGNGSRQRRSGGEAGESNSVRIELEFVCPGPDKLDRSLAVCDARIFAVLGATADK